MATEESEFDVESWVDDCIKYYNQYALRQLIIYRMFKLISILASAFVPVAALFGAGSKESYGPITAAILGAIALASETANQIMRSHDNWVSAVKAAEQLESEEVLFKMKAGAYATSSSPHKLFAERAVAVASSESSNWVRSQLESNRNTQGPATYSST